MRIIRLQAEGFKRLVAVDISPEGDLIELRGNNGNGKSSVLDAIFAALGGAHAAPEKPVRDGEEVAIIKLDLGDLIVTRYFTAAGTTNLKVTNPDGMVASNGQTMLNELVGHISFDPLEFLDLKPEEQAEELRKLVDITDPETGELIDLAALEAANKADYDKRRDVNRDGANLRARIEGMGGVRHVPEDAPDRSSIEAQLASAGETNAARDAEDRRRDDVRRQRGDKDNQVAELEQRAAGMRKALEDVEEAIERTTKEAQLLSVEIAGWTDEQLPERVDTAALTAELASLSNIEDNRRHNTERERLKGEFNDLAEESKALTQAMADRNATRAKAIAAAKMPVEGLALVVGEDGKLGVEFGGVPFSQASDAERLRTSAAVAMAANPRLRVIRLKNAALLDKAATETLRQLAGEHDFQIWAEFVGDEGAGIIMEAGEVRGAEKPEPLPRPRTRKPKEDGDASTDSAESATEIGETSTGAGEVSRETRPRGGTLFERMSEMSREQKPKPRPQAMTEFVTKPRGE